MTHLPINQPPPSVQSHKTKGGGLAKPLGNRESLVPWSWGGGERQSVGEGKGSHLTLGRGGGSIGLDFPGHKISKPLLSISVHPPFGQGLGCLGSPIPLI